MNIDVFIELVVFQSEGIKPVFDFLEANKIRNITISPEYFVETGDVRDLRLPPLDLDGEDRVLERPLFNGETVKYGKRFLCFEPAERLYSDTSYRPSYQLSDIDYCALVLQEAEKRDIKVALFMPNVPKDGYRADDFPVDVEGVMQIPKISNQACINSKNVSNYYLSLAKDLIQTYQPSMLMIDWMEFTNYFFSDNLLCFCDSCKKKMTLLNYDVKKLENAAREAFTWIKAQESVPAVDGLGWKEIWTIMSPDILYLFKFKRKSVESIVATIRKQLDAFGKSDVELLFTGFCLPMNIGTGFDFTLSNSIENVLLQPKAYRFHWGLMVRWYSEELAKINGKTIANDWIPFVKNLLEVTDSSNEFEYFKMPSPTEVGPIDFDSECKKIASVLELVGNTEKASFRVHGYGTTDIFKQRIAYARRCGYKNISIQRYGYLCDDKIISLKGE